MTDTFSRIYDAPAFAALSPQARNLLARRALFAAVEAAYIARGWAVPTSLEYASRSTLEASLAIALPPCEHEFLDHGNGYSDPVTCECCGVEMEYTGDGIDRSRDGWTPA